MATETTRVRVVLYARVSHIESARDRRRDTRSTDQQLGSLRRNADKHPDWTIVAELIDDDRSASRFATRERPDFKRLKAMVAGGEVDLLSAWEMSRYERKTKDWIELVDACKEAGVRLEYSGKIIDPRNPIERLDAIWIHRPVNGRPYRWT